MGASHERKVHYELRAYNGNLMCGYGSPLTTRNRALVTCKICLHMLDINDRIQQSKVIDERIIDGDD